MRYSVGFWPALTSSCHPGWCLNSTWTVAGLSQHSARPETPDCPRRYYHYSAICSDQNYRSCTPAVKRPCPTCGGPAAGNWMFFLFSLSVKHYALLLPVVQKQLTFTHTSVLCCYTVRCVLERELRACCTLKIFINLINLFQTTDMK